MCKYFEATKKHSMLFQSNYHHLPFPLFENIMSPLFSTKINGSNQGEIQTKLSHKHLQLIRVFKWKSQICVKLCMLNSANTHLLYALTISIQTLKRNITIFVGSPPPPS